MFYLNHANAFNEMRFDFTLFCVVQQPYAVDVYDEFVMRGNTAVLKCHVPGLVQDYVTITSWIRDGSFVIRPTALAGDRFSIFLTGELHIRRVDHADGLQKYRCETRHRLTGETVLSATSGRLLVTETFRDSPPRITDSKRMLKIPEGETLEVPCAAQGFPVPTYEWYRKENRDRLAPLQIGNRLLQLDGTLVLREARVEDSGQYVCKVQNTAGSDSAETEILVTAPLSAQVLPKLQSVDVGKSATFNCSSSGHPVVTIEWMKDGMPLRAGSRIEFPSRDVVHLTYVQRDDKGMFQCFVSNDFDSAQGTAQLSLGDYPPSLLETFTDQTLEPGPSVTLKCVAQGNPLPQIIWTLDSGTIPENTRFRLGDYVRTGRDSTEVVSYVNITSVRPEDGGLYECEASNDVGKATHSARVNVFGPPFVRSMSNMSVVAGETLRLQCPVGGHPIETIKWEKDGVRLPLNHRQKVFPNGTLLVRNIEKASDSGPYKCSASNADGITAENSLHIKVIVRPLIEPFAFPKSLQTGQRFSVLCTVTEGDPPIRIQWIKDGLQSFLASAHDGVRSVVVTPFSTTLVFESLAPEHRGNYTCVASNAAGTMSHTAPMVIHVPPRWRIEPGDTSVIKSRSAVVDCQADGFPIPRIRWTRAEGDVASEFRPISSSSRLHVFENGSLVIHSVEEGDDGHYLCQATNGIGQGLSKVIRLSVHVAAHFKSKFRAESVRKGEDAKLICEAIGDRPLQITWLKDKQSFEPQIDLRYELTETVLGSGTTSELTIRRADRRDSALYTCIASNAFGQDDTNIQLIMQEPPDAPQDVKVLEFGSRIAKLGWSAPYSGNSPITHFILHYKEEADRWQQKSWNITIPGNENNVVVRGLQPVTFYHFRLYAENILGKSEPSNVVHLRMDQEAPGGPPQKVKARATGAHVVKVTWKPPRKDLQFGLIKGYYVGYKEAGSKDTFIYKTLNAKGGENFIEETQLTDLKKFTEYAIIVQAFNAKGAGPPTDQVLVKTLQNDPPGSPVLKVSFTNQTAIGLTWDQTETDNPVQGYILYHKWDMGDWQETELSATEMEYSLYELKCGSRYQFYVTAFNSVGRGVPSDILRTKTDGRAPVAPDKQSMLSINQTSAAVHLDAWHDGGCPLTSFAVRYRQQRQQVWNLVTEGGPEGAGRSHDRLRNQVILDDLIPGTWYRLQVTAHNEAGSTDAEYTFVTNPVSSDTAPSYPVNDDNAQELPLYLDINILVPAAVSLAVVIALVILVCVIMYKRSSQDTNQTGGNSDTYSNRKCQVHENVQMTKWRKALSRKLFQDLREVITTLHHTPRHGSLLKNKKKQRQDRQWKNHYMLLSNALHVLRDQIFTFIITLVKCQNFSSKLPKVHVWMMSELHQVAYFGKNLRKRPSRTNTTAINCLQIAAALVEAENLTDIHKGEDVLQLVQLFLMDVGSTKAKVKNVGVNS
ncbi:down syndrome cell adhesion molecule-like protein Dscam2 [Trichonephila clavata]|uniref:Down syndrome cell adhesion molecule-like protein Dscam2 n=1 Tax=Trichonephila clavata TaxID=2740835 RepID=A0A8X6KU87_TRICU|nr:down syndrome cell adhesion molecule-like protein Dscam2 [Trichonephila clavata]